MLLEMNTFIEVKTYKLFLTMRLNFKKYIYLFVRSENLKHKPGASNLGQIESEDHKNRLQKINYA